LATATRCLYCRPHGLGTPRPYSTTREGTRLQHLNITNHSRRGGLWHSWSNGSHWTT